MVSLYLVDLLSWCRQQLQDVTKALSVPGYTPGLCHTICFAANSNSIKFE